MRCKAIATYENNEQTTLLLENIIHHIIAIKSKI